MRRPAGNFRSINFIPWLLVFALACGTPAATPTPVPEPAPALPADRTPTMAAGETPQPTPTSAPVAEPASTPERPEAVTPAGTLNVGLKETGSYNGHPTMAVNPGLFVSQTPPLGEGLLFTDVNYEIKGWLAESWSISEDFTTWTFKIRQGVQFHKGYGEMTAEDVAWSYVEGWAANDKHVRASEFKAFWTNPEGSVEAPDRYTVVVNTETSLSEAVVMQNWMTAVPGGSANWVASQRQSQELGIEAANKDPALTGSWEFVRNALPSSGGCAP